MATTVERGGEKILVLLELGETKGEAVTATGAVIPLKGREN